MRIGLDLDGTIVVYDDVFHRHAVERFALPADVPADKTAVRDWLRRNPPGEHGWIELQRVVYGLRMVEASLAPGVAGFLRDCRDAGIDISIVSHKTRLSVAAPRVDLHAAALDWLDGKGFFAADGFGLARDRVFFEPTRIAKLRRIASENCALFVDDLEEVLAEATFPGSVERWLYATDGRVSAPVGVTMFSDWRVLAERVHDLREAEGAH
jgi:hypothetical protein